VDGISVNPLNPIAPILPKSVDDAAQKAAAAAAAAAAQAAAAAAQKAKEAAEAAAQAAAAPYVAIIDVATGKPVASALQGTVAAQAKALETAGEAASAATENAENVKVAVAGAIAGDPGKTTMQLTIGADRLQQEFASTAVIESADVLQGANADQLLAAPLAAALRAAQAQFSPTALPVPDSVKQQLSPFYTPAQLNMARYAISTISISVPDLITHGRKTLEGTDFAVTVGNIIVFIKDPGNDYHWWAHEMQHTVQYSTWGIDKFAYNYVTSCHSVEKDAEDHAQAAFPFAVPAQLGC
jgi:hypothetical protein